MCKIPTGWIGTLNKDGVGVTLKQAAPFIVLEHLEHCSGTVLNGGESGDSGTYLTCDSNTNFLVIRYFYLLYIPLHE